MPEQYPGQVNPNCKWELWHTSELYGPTNPGGYLPNIDDVILDFGSGLHRVTSVDYTALTYTTVPWRIPAVNGVSQEDTLMGAGPGLISESYRVGIDKRTTPYTLSFDARLRVPSPAARYVKVFKGYDVSEGSGQVISRQYDVAGNFISENIPLAWVHPDHPELGRAPMVAHTLADLKTHDVVTAVVYGDEGIALSLNHLLVEETAYIRHTDASTKYVIDISIESPYLNDDGLHLDVPINQTVQSVAMMGVVTYSDYSTIRLPIDGTKFHLDGMNNYVATIVGQSNPVVLKYYLAPNEAYVGGLNGSEHHVARPYRIRSRKVNGANTVKLYSFPTWEPENSRYGLKHYIANLDRTFFKHVTGNVRITQNSAPFNPNRYGVLQEISLVVNLEEVSSFFTEFYHVQTVGISLIGPGTDSGTLWTMEFTPNQVPPYGWNLTARVEFINAGYWKLRLGSGRPSREVWLQDAYWAIQPLFDPQRETRAPEPNLMRIHFKNSVVEQTLDQWNADLIVPNDYQQGETLVVEFVRRLPTGDQHLGAAGFTVHIV